MSSNRKNAMIYFAAGILLAIAAFLNIKNNDYVFIVVCGVSSIIFFIAGFTAHKNIKKKPGKKGSTSTKSRKK